MLVQKRILRAELWAMLQLLVACISQLVVHVDNASVVDGVARGRRWCCHSNGRTADVWRVVWHQLDDVGIREHGVRLVKCKSHQSATVLMTLSAE